MDDILEKGGVSKEIIYFLKAAGYNTLSSVKLVNPNSTDLLTFAKNQTSLNLLYKDVATSTDKFLPRVVAEINIAVEIAKVNELTHSVYEQQTEESTTPFVLLNKMNDRASYNTGSYDENFKLFCCWDFLTGGRKNYETRSKNLPLPSASCISKTLSSSFDTIVEGVLRIDEYLDWCTVNGFDPTCTVSEDGTRVVAIPNVDLKRKCIVGFVPRLDSNGIPVGGQFFVRNNTEIADLYEKEEKASTLYLMIAQSVTKGAPPFVLLAFGTDNKFTHQHAFNRFGYIEQRFSDRNVRVLGYCGDQDSRLFKAMKSSIKLGAQDDDIPPRWRSFFFAKFAQRIVCSDHLHFIVKLKTALTKKSSLMRFGVHLLSIAPYLNVLEHSSPKDKLPFSRSDLNNLDKMNVTSALNIASKESEIALSKFPNTLGVRLFTRIMRYPVEAYYFNNLTDLQRLKKIWYSIFLARGWRHHCNAKEFITPQSYLALELNGHSLLNLHKLCRDENRPDLFIPALFNSQTCESEFRCMRSLSGMESTNVNFTVLQALQRIKRIEAMRLIEHKLAKLGYQFPRLEKEHHRGQWMELENLATEDEVLTTIEDVRELALQHLELVGIKLNKEDLTLKIKCIEESELQQGEESNSLNEVDLNEEFGEGTFPTVHDNPDDNLEENAELNSNDEIDMRSFCARLGKFEEKDRVKLDRLDRFSFKSHGDRSKLPMKLVADKTEQREHVFVGDYLILKQYKFIFHVLDICLQPNSTLKQQNKPNKVIKKNKITLKGAGRKRKSSNVENETPTPNEKLRRSQRAKKVKVNPDIVQLESTSDEELEQRVKATKKKLKVSKTIQQVEDEDFDIRKKKLPVKKQKYEKYPLFYCATSRVDLVLICEKFKMNDSGYLELVEDLENHFNLTDYQFHAPTPDPITLKFSEQQMKEIKDLFKN